MPIIDWSSKRIKIDPGSDITEILEELQKSLDSKVTAAVLNAALAAEKAERVEGDAQVEEASKLILTEEDPEAGTHNGYILTQGNRVVGHIHTPSIIKRAYLEKDGEVTYLVLEFEGAVEPVRLDVSELIDIYTGSAGDMITISIAEDNTISATVNNASITREKVAADIEESLQKADDAAQYTDEQVAAEKAERIASDDALGVAIANEAERATSAESELSRIIAEETSNRISADETITEKVESYKALLDAKDEEQDGRMDAMESQHSADVTALQAKDTEIEEALQAEVERSTSKDEELTSAIEAEVEERTSEIQRVDAAIAAETARAEEKEGELQASIAEEAISRSEADSALETAYKTADTQIISDYQAADEAVKAWVDDKKYATVAQLNATEATHQADVQRIEGEIEAHKAETYTKDEVDELVEGAGGSMPAIVQRLPYLYEAEYTTLDYDYANEHIVDPVFAGCAVAKKESVIGRNYDWKYDETADFIVRTPAQYDRHSVLGLCGGLPALTTEKVEGGSYDPAYKLLPFSMLDGINDAGLYASINVAELRSMPSEGDVCNTMSVRYILDNFSTVDAVINSGISIYNHPQLAAAGYETILFLADATKSVVIDGGEVIATDRLTNFHLDGVVFNADGTVNTPGNNPSLNNITGAAAGLERWNLLVNGASIQDLYYTNGYTDRWYSEFTDDVNGTDYVTKWAAAKEAFLERQRDGKTWHTVHSCEYDIEAKKVVITPQEDGENIEVTLTPEIGASVTLNGEKVNNAAFYAPLDGGEKGKVLIATEGAPEWKTSKRSITLSKADYEALSDDEKNADDVIYYVEDDDTSDYYINRESVVGSKGTYTTDKEIYSAKAVNDILDTFFDQVYPIGTYIVASMKPTRGTWTEVTDSTGRALWLQRGKNWGSTIAQGLPNITGSVEAQPICLGKKQTIGAITIKDGPDAETKYGTVATASQYGNYLTFDASKSNSIYGASTKVQPYAYTVRVWHRTA